MVNDHIEKQIELDARIARVWRALTNFVEFGEWFRVKLDGPFVPGHYRQVTLLIRVTST
jgi:uncharacterized protein YndB with AHSA1/START domain